MSDCGQCSFCGKSEERVKRLIAGPGVYICDECVALCQEILTSEQRASNVATEAASTASSGRAAALGVDVEALTANLHKLTYLKRRVIELRYGLNGESPRTRTEIARTFRLSLEKLARIEDESLLALRGPPQP